MRCMLEMYCFKMCLLRSIVPQVWTIPYIKTIGEIVYLDCEAIIVSLVRDNSDSVPYLLSDLTLCLSKQTHTGDKIKGPVEPWNRWYNSLSNCPSYADVSQLIPAHTNMGGDIVRDCVCHHIL